MSLPDFWNLAGRAGRWGTEFQGNIVCIDVADRDQWPNPPGRRQRGPITKSLETAVSHTDEIFDYLAADAPPADDRFSELVEASFSFLASRRASDVSSAPLTGSGYHQTTSTASKHASTPHLSTSGFPNSSFSGIRGSARCPCTGFTSH